MIYLLPQPTGTKFPLGDIYITEGAQARLSAAKVINCLARHGACDWGDLCEEDIESNLQALEYHGGLQSAFGKGEDRFWIVTNGQRTQTTITLVSEYLDKVFSGEPFPAENNGGRV